MSFTTPSAVLAGEEDVYDDDLWYGLQLASPEGLVNYREKPFYERIYNALVRSHDYFEALSFRPGDSPTRLVRIMNFYGYVLTNMVIIAMIYQVR